MNGVKHCPACNKEYKYMTCTNQVCSVNQPKKKKSKSKALDSNSIQEMFWCKWGCCDGRRCEHKPGKARKFRTSW